MSGGKPLRLADSTVGRPSGMTPVRDDHVIRLGTLRRYFAKFIGAHRKNGNMMGRVCFLPLLQLFYDLDIASWQTDDYIKANQR